MVLNYKIWLICFKFAQLFLNEIMYINFVVFIMF